MSAHVVHGYLIHQHDYGEFDQILMFVTTDNLIISCLALGVRKLTSKNARNLFIGHLLTIEYFQARVSGKMSKLKKVSINESLVTAKLTHPGINFINSLLVQCGNSAINNLWALMEVVYYQINAATYHVGLIINYFLIHLALSLGINFHWQSCCVCNNPWKISSLSPHLLGFLCYQCALVHHSNIWTKSSLMLFYYLVQSEWILASNYWSGAQLVYGYLQLVYQINLGININLTYEYA